MLTSFGFASSGFKYKIMCYFVIKLIIVFFLFMLVFLLLSVDTEKVRRYIPNFNGQQCSENSPINT